MRIIGPELVSRHGDTPSIADAIAAILADDLQCPLRQRYTLERAGCVDATLLTMPAWSADGFAMIKVAMVIPDNRMRGKPSVSSNVILMNAVDGSMLAMLDGEELTARRTAAASLLASRFLSRADSRRMTMMGTGSLAKPLVRAHLAARPNIDHIWIWGRSLHHASRVADELAAEGMPAIATADPEAAISVSDIVSAATPSSEPLIKGAWLKPGAHVDLVGGFTLAMREADDDCMRRARIFCDQRTAAPLEAGDLGQPIAAGLINRDDIVDLIQLCRGEAHGRKKDQEITVFKSVGFAAEDLAAAICIYRRVTAGTDIVHGQA